MSGDRGGTRRANTPWLEGVGEVVEAVRLQSECCLEGYRANPLLVKENANIERHTAQGGYGRRQIYELVQNGADALIGRPAGRIQVVLSEGALYCANEGAPIDAEGVQAILTSHMSMKRGTEIGRFGLGFKSVLSISKQPAVFSRSGSFIFDEARSAERIRQIVPDIQHVPTLRIAEPISPAEQATMDPILAELMQWATTVIRLPRTESDASWLTSDLAIFPAEFLLFSPHVSGLTFDDRVVGIRREIRLRKSGDGYILTNDKETSEWRIFSKDHRPSDHAKKDAGEVADRDTLPLVWAVPTSGRDTRGRFWAFFPTENETTLSGILNAPWKTNGDRQNLLKSDFNLELLDAMSSLIVESLPLLVVRRDPARVLDLLPARDEGSTGWAGEYLSKAIFSLAARNPSIPDQSGDCRPPIALRIHPTTVRREWVEAWSNHPRRPTDWCHSSVETRERRPRADRLRELAGVGYKITSIAAWLEELVTDFTPQSSMGALRLAARIVKDDPTRKADVADAEIALTADGTLVSTRPGQIFRPAGNDRLDSGATVLHHKIARASEMRDALNLLDIPVVDVAGQLKSSLARGVKTWAADDWESFWHVAAELGADRTNEALTQFPQETADLRVKVLSGEFRRIDEVLLPGHIASPERPADHPYCVDLAFHVSHIELLTMLGIATGPTAGGGRSSERWFGDYRRELVDRYLQDIKSRQRPQRNYIEVWASVFPGPLELMDELSGPALAEMTISVLKLATDLTKTVKVRHSTADRYPIQEYEAPWVWRLRHAGLLVTSIGTQAVPDCVGPAFEAWREFLPVASCTSKEAALLGLPESPAEMSAGRIEAAFLHAIELADDGAIGRVVELAATLPIRPRLIPARQHRVFGLVDPTTVLVASSNSEALVLGDGGAAVLLLESRVVAATLIERWSLQSGSDKIRVELRAVPSGDAVFVIDEYPDLKRILPAQTATQIVRCSDIELDTVTDAGRSTEARPSFYQDDIVYLLDEADEVDALLEVGRHLGLGLSRSDCEAILSNRDDHIARKRLAAIREQPDLHLRLLAALGVERLRRQLPAGLLQALGGGGEPEDVARSALAVFGVDVLHEFRGELEAAGLAPPRQWAGTRPARDFVSSLGFPPEYAGFTETRRDAVLETDGPVELPPLHAFQRIATDNVRAVLSSAGGGRALLSLPTGAGKTRVTVEAIIEHVKYNGFDGPVIWIAQSDELCEQAVQTWSYVWRATGPRRRLVVSRHWSHNSASEAGPGTFHVVVATIDKLVVTAQNNALPWLSTPTCVVVDEAHMSTTTSYTQVLEWVGLRHGKERCPLIGLSATPFRGTSADQTERLVNRYGGRRLDHGIFDDDPYKELQRLGVLAKVKTALIDGAEVQLSSDELDELNLMRRLPRAVEERLGSDGNRNATIIRSIAELPSDYSVLLFAPSVPGAQTLAALLTREGISAQAISAATDPGARRHYIEEFRRKRIRVLANYNVLAQGFDAPAVEAVYVARPTYSPNVYQQMIGRGLRGRQNGGTDECLIVDVVDNVRQFGHELAFREFEYLWK